MEPVFTAELPDIEVDYLQYLHYEVSSYKLILSDILIEKNPKYKYSKENYEHFMSEYKEALMRLDLYMNEIVERYAPKYLGDSNYTYDVSFSECTLNIFKKEDKLSSCKCGGAK